MESAGRGDGGSTVKAPPVFVRAAVRADSSA